MTTPAIDLYNLLDQAVRSSHFSRNSLQRGAHYAADGNVSDLHAEWIDSRSRLLVESAVKGSARTPYLLGIDLIRRQGNRLDVEGECSCPVGFNCKHVAATLLILRERALETAIADGGVDAQRVTPAHTPQWQDWLARLDAHPAPPGRSQLPDGLTLAMLFDATDDRPPGLVARVVWVEPTKVGRLGKPRPLVDSQLHEAAYQSLLDDAWRDRIGRLATCQPVYRNNISGVLLSGRRGEALLLDCLQADIPCFWQKPAKQPLRLEPAQSAPAWRWAALPDGRQRPEPVLPAGAQLIKIDRFWLLHAKQRWLAPVDANTEATAIAQALLEFPETAPDHAAELARAWQAHPRLRELPAPHTFASAAIADTPPTPVLRLHQQTLRSGYGSKPGTLAYARLHFDYDGFRFPGPAMAQAVTRLRDGALYRIDRQHAVENEIEQRLDRAGFEPLLERYDLDWRLTDSASDADYVPRKPRKALGAKALLGKLSPLQEQGFRLEFDTSFPVELSAATPEHWYLDADEAPSNGDWFDLELGIEVDGQRISLLPILQRALADNRLSMQPAPDEPADALWHAPIDASRHVALPLQQVRAMLAPLLQWLDGSDHVRVPRAAAGLLDELGNSEHARLRTHSSQALSELAGQLRTGKPTRRIAQPRALKAQLRDYQRDGLDWLGFLARHRLGGVLADDMGLGKTLQVLAHVLAEKQARRLKNPALVVAPTSVVGNWRDQAESFAPSLRVRVLHGSDRHGHFDTLDDCDLAVTTYALLPRDREILLAQPFTLAVFDEAQAIKNPRSQAAIVARELQAERRLAVTGTPVENHLGELWSQIDCVLPGLLGDSRTFGRVFRTPIEKHGDVQAQQRLQRRIAPFLLRRRKEQVAKELPPKTEIVHRIELDGKQRDLYETLRLAMHERVQQAIKQRGLGQSSIVILDALLKLRQACCDPRLVKLESARALSDSAKLDALMPMLEEMLDEGRRILLFSQFTQMLDLIEAALRRRKHDWLRLDGSTSDRDTPIRRFQSGECPLMLISLKAGGVGLNLTAADTVIHFDPWWNPAVERQATDRAHRIGQDKPVFVYRLICAGTVEEKIQALQQRKAELAEAVLDGGGRQGLRFDEADIAELFAPLKAAP